MNYTIKNKVFCVEYKTFNNGYNDSIFIESDSFKEAINIFELYMKDLGINRYELKKISTYQDIIKPITKTITVNL